MSERCCPACGEARARERGLKNDLRVCACCGCGTLYARGPAGGDAGYDYETYYHEANLCVPPFVERRLDEIVSGFAPLRRTNRLLDVGCGAGSLLGAARRAGWDALGIEVSPPAAAHARAAGFRVFLGELEEARFPAAHFDVVTASEILEHLPDPRALLAEVVRVLRPGGMFWGTTPHGRGLSARALGLRWSTLSPPEHLQLFSLGGLRRLLRAAGFTSVRLTAQGFNHYELREAWWRRRAGADVQTAAGDGTPNGAVAGFDRVRAAYQLNETLMRSRAGRLAKAALNGVLGAARAGDSIKFRAIK